ncbi:hypothetical protein [Coleofasciculus sp. FACHB-1120]|uniref:hypothetical protein n=1 Tax=Coleofasciculus sp. FACHB-1120 TaxID=2692783 RepID=UPI00168914F7|nr:hypothetical protein [Coleofasciculus sp. FACHB-1120]MBD2742600.1 hypothetical protein [Coleofasciculus sp. FACHB-1120]
MIAQGQLRQYALPLENQAMLQERARIVPPIHHSFTYIPSDLNIPLEGAQKHFPSESVNLSLAD